MQNPTVTVAIPTYNRCALLERALSSALDQTYRNLEILVCDDGSTDGTREFLDTCSDPRVRFVLPRTNRGMFANFNAALKEARGEYFLMLDDHDYLEPTCIDTLMQPWRIRNNLAFSYGQYWYHDHLGARLEASAGPEIEDGFDYVANYWTGERATLLYGCLFRKQSLLAAGGFPEMMALDVLAILRTAFEGGVAYVRQPVTHYELQPTSMTHNIPLCRLIQEREEMLQTCLRAAAARQISRRRLENLEFRVYKDLARQSASTLLLLRGRGLSRAALMKESRQLTRYLRHRWVLSAICSTLAFTFPPATVNWFRRWHRRLGHLPADDISLGLRPGLSGGRL